MKSKIIHLSQSSFDCSSILKSGSVAGGRASKDGRRTFFRASQSDVSEWSRRMTKRRLRETDRKHYRSKWRPAQDAVYWVNLDSTWRRITILADMFECRCWRQFCATTLDLQGKFSKWRTSLIRGAGDASQQQQQQDTSGSASACSWQQNAKTLVKEEMKKKLGNSTKEAETSRSRKLLRSDATNITHVEEKPDSDLQPMESWWMKSEWAKHKGGKIWHTRKLCDLQRGIQTRHPWTGQHWPVRIRPNVQHHPVPFVLHTFAGSAVTLW